MMFYYEIMLSKQKDEITATTKNVGTFIDIGEHFTHNYNKHASAIKTKISSDKIRF